MKGNSVYMFRIQKEVFELIICGLTKIRTNYSQQIGCADIKCNIVFINNMYAQATLTGNEAILIMFT